MKVVIQRVSRAEVRRRLPQIQGACAALALAVDLSRRAVSRVQGVSLIHPLVASVLVFRAVPAATRYRFAPLATLL